MTAAASGRVLILGADGFIGRHVAVAARRAGWHPVCIARRTRALDAMGFETRRADLARPACRDPAFWRETARDADAVVNAAGLLTGSPATLAAVHAGAPAALFAALPADARIVQISAAGTDAGTAFAAARRAGEDAANAAPGPAVILRPGLVLGETSYGGSSLLRALAAMPFATPLVGAGRQPMDPLHADDLARLALDAAAGRIAPGTYPVGGDETLEQAALVARLRAWMGLAPVPVLPLPAGLARALGRLGDVLRLGPVSSASVAQLEHGVRAEGPGRIDLPGLSGFLGRRPAGTQDLWHARLYLLRPLIRLTPALLWLGSGLLGLLLPAAAFQPAVGVALPDAAAVLLARAAGLADLAIAAALVRDWRPRLLAGVQLAAVAAYTVAFGLVAPGLWLLPFGGLLKNLPILALLVVHAALAEER